MGQQTSEYAHEIKWEINDLLRTYSGQPDESEKTATRNVAKTVGNRLASTCVGKSDPVRFTDLAELVQFPVGVEGVIEPVDVACASFAEYIATAGEMQQYTTLTERQFSVLKDSLLDVRRGGESSPSEPAVH